MNPLSVFHTGTIIHIISVRNFPRVSFLDPAFKLPNSILFVKIAFIRAGTKNALMAYLLRKFRIACGICVGCPMWPWFFCGLTWCRCVCVVKVLTKKWLICKTEGVKVKYFCKCCRLLRRGRIKAMPYIM